MAKKGHRDGGKYAGHTTVIEAACPVVDALHGLDEVSKITITMIEQTSSVAQQATVTHKPTISGLEVKVRGNKYVQTFYIVTSQTATVQAFLEERFPRPENKGKRKGRRGGKKNKTHVSARNWAP